MKIFIIYYFFLLLSIIGKFEPLISINIVGMFIGRSESTFVKIDLELTIVDLVKCQTNLDIDE